MKRFFISGYNYIQDVALEPGTYTFWAYIKSDFGNTFTFALANAANEWEVFDVDVQQGQWTKAYEVFTIKERKIKLSLIYRYFDAEHPVYVLKPQLIKGNIPSDAGSSPFDIDKVTDDLHDAIGGIEDFTNEEFADRVLSSGERVSLRRDLEAVEVIFQSLKGSYEKLLINPFVNVLVLADLTAKYNAVSSAKDQLFTTINTIIDGDNIVTPEEIAAKDLALSSLNSAIYDYNTAEKEIANALGEDYTQQISAIRDFTDTEFNDRRLSETEKVSLSHDLDIVQTLLDEITAGYNEIVLNPYLTVADIQLLTDKYNALFDAWDWDYDIDPSKPDGLKTVILDIINGDEIVTQAEIDEKDLALANFNNKLGEYSTAEVQMSKFTIDHAIEQAAFWSINATSPVIYKDAKDAITDGVHTQVTVKGQLHRGTDIQDGGFITITPNGETEPATAVASPITISPSDNADKSSYTVRLYDTASKTTLLDTLTIPVVFKGASGINAINVVLSNEADVLPASPEGVVSDYSGSGTTIRVFEGATELDYDGIGTANGKFNVTATGTGITAGAKAESGLQCVFSNASNMTSDNATITFTVSGKTLNGESFNITKVQSFAKSKAGKDGNGIIQVIDYYGLSASASSQPTEWQTTVPVKAANKFLWNYEKIIYTDGTFKETEKRVIQANDARSIYDIKNAYAYSPSDTVSPTGGWVWNLADLGTKPEGYFLWVREDIAYTDDPSNYFSTTGHVVRDGEPGEPGRGIQSIVNAYGYSTDYTTPPVAWYYLAQLPEKQPGQVLWVREDITYTDGTSSATVGYPVRDGEKGDNGLPGALLVQKEWVQGDTHRYTDEIKDYIYVRGASASQSYFYTLANKGTIIAGAAPVGGANVAGYVRVTWMESLAVKFLLVEEANLANLIFKDYKLISLRGTVNGVAADYSGQANFVPNIVIDGKTGKISAVDGEFTGTVHATDGEFTGTVNSTSGNIGGFSIGVGSLQAISGSNSMLLSSNLVRFLGQYSSVYIGADTFPASGGGAILGTQRVEINRTVESTVYGNVGIYFDIKGSTAYDNAGLQYTGNHAIYAKSGDYAGFRLRTRRVSTSQTLSDMDNVIICTNSSTITLTLPSSPKDGQIYIITSISSGYFIIKVGNTSSHIIFRTQEKTHTEYRVDTGRDRLFFLIWDKVNLIWKMGQTGGW